MVKYVKTCMTIFNVGVGPLKLRVCVLHLNRDLSKGRKPINNYNCIHYYTVNK